MILENQILDHHCLVIEDGIITKIMEGSDVSSYEGAEILDANGAYVSPGFIDLHSDYIENVISPRPTAMMDFRIGLHECERILAIHGITTIYHSLSLYDDQVFGVKQIRKSHNTHEIIRLINAIESSNSLIRHRVHARLEIDHFEMIPVIEHLIETKQIHMLSLMDHTPGQGQYRDLEIYKQSVVGLKHLNDLDADVIIRQRQHKAKMTAESIDLLAKHAVDHGVILASHDDDSFEKLEFALSIKTSISEFPITLDVAKKAREIGLQTVAGAPNILLGASHSGNLSALEGIRNGVIDILTSDYYPSGLVHAVFAIHRELDLDLPAIIRMMTINPAKAVKLDTMIGSIALGKKADLLVIGGKHDMPAINTVIVGGQISYKMGYPL